MGGSSGSSTSTYSPPPEVAAAYKQLLSNAQPLFTAPYQPYTAGKAETASEMVPLTVAPQTPNQVAAGQNIASLAGYYQPYANAATDLVQQGSQPIQLQQFNNQSVGQYMSPFMQNVMGSTVANINETNAQQQQQVLGNAIAKGAYGGDRAGIAQSELARQQNLANNATLANIANTGYNSALGQFNAMNQQGIQAQLGSGQLAQSGASALGNLGTMGQNAALQQAQAQYNIGGAQQQQKQAELSTAYQNYLNQIAYPYQQAQFEGGLISGVASGSGGTTTSTPAQPGAANQIIGGLGALGSLGSLFGGGGGAAGAAGAAGAGGFGSFLGGIGSGVGAAASGIGEGLGAVISAIPFLSDERAKENIHPVGKTFDGQNIYKFNYKGDRATQIGLMAQEVEHHHPSAVGEWHGLKTVNYDAATKGAEHRGHFAQGGDVQQQQGLLGVSPIAGMTASSYLPTGQNAMANPHMPQAPTGKHPNDFSKDQLSDAVKGIRTLMGKPDPSAKPDAKTDSPPPVQPISPIQQDAFGGRIHHYGVGGVADATPDVKSAAASPAHSDSFDALKASQQKYTQTLPNAGVIPAPQTSTGVTGGATNGTPIDSNAQALHNPGLARSNYSNLANSGNASLADLQSAYDIYMRSHATPEAITQVQMGSGTPTTTEVASSDNFLSSGPEGGGGGGNNAYGGRIHPHHFGAGGGILNYSGLPTKKTVEEGAQSVIGSGASYDPTLASIASQDYLPEEKAARGGVIGREHHAGPDDTNGQSNVVGNGPTPDEVITQALPRIKQLESGGKNIPNASGSAAYGPYQFMPNTFSGTAQRHPESGVDPNDHKNPEAQEKLAPFHARDLAEAYKKANLPFDNNALRMGWAFGEQGGPAFMKGAAADPNAPSTSLAGQAAIKANPSWFFNPDGSTKTAAQTISFLTGGMNGAAPRASAPQSQSQGQEQPRQGPMQLNQTATKEGLSGMLGISMTDNQRLAAFNAFAKLAGTPGKFGVGLAAAADTYSKTLMEANKQQREGYTAESEAKLRAEQATSQRVKQEGMTTQVRKTDPVTGAVTVENQIIPPGQTATFAGQGQTGSGSSTATGAPSAPSSPQTPKEINLLGPVAAGEDGTAKFDTLQKLADEALKTYSATPGEAQKMYFSKSAELYENQKAANASRPDLKSAIQSVSEMGGGGLTGAGPGSEYRTAIANYINLGLRSFGVEGGINERDIANKQVLDKLATIQANQAHGSNAARWLDSVKNAYPQTELTEQAAKNLTASLMVTNTMHNDMGNFANEYGKRTYGMGYNVTQAFNQVNPANLYSQAKDDIARLMIERNGTIPTKDGRSVRGNPVSALAMGVMTPEEFNDYARRNGSKISNLARFVTGGE